MCLMSSSPRLVQAINNKLNIPLQDMHLSKNPALLTSKAPQVGSASSKVVKIASCGDLAWDKCIRLPVFGMGTQNSSEQ